MDPIAFSGTEDNIWSIYGLTTLIQNLQVPFLWRLLAEAGITLVAFAYRAQWRTEAEFAICLSLERKEIYFTFHII